MIPKSLSEISDAYKRHHKTDNIDKEKEAFLFPSKVVYLQHGLKFTFFL